MADVPKRVPWLDHIKRTGKLTIFIDDSIGRAGWAQVFRNAILEFNKLSRDHKLGVTLVAQADQNKANVEARAAAGDIEFSYPPDIPKETIRFDSTKPHGLTRTVMTKIVDRGTVQQFRVVKAFIHVPSTPRGIRNGTPSPVGDPVKLVIAVHELIHVCGLVDNSEHSVDDVFSWPNLRMGNKPSEDRVGTLGGQYTFPGKPGEPDRVGHRVLEMPPILLKRETAEKIRQLWS
jgi:hypothetical protein